jgi:hypothetical protein
VVFSHWNLGPDKLSGVYGKPFAELYADWRSWDLERCAELGLILN